MASASSSALVIHGAVDPETGGEHDHLNKSISIATPTVDSDVVALRLGYRTLTQEYTLTKKSKNNKHGASSSDENDDIHKLTQHELELRFATTVDQGLQPDVVSRRLAKFGNNAISPPPTNYFAKATEHLFGGFAGIMWFAGIVVFISWKPLGEPNPAPANLTLSMAIFVVIFLQASFTAYQDWQSSKIMNSINQMLPQSATALRDGTVATIPVPDLVQGDVVHLKYGEKVPADLRLVSVNGLKIDNSILTGESLPINATVNATNNNATESHNIALMGTFITEGEGTGVVVATGDNTMMGRVAKLASSSTIDRTILQDEIRRFVMIIASLCFLTATGCFIWYLAFLQYHYPNFYTLSGFLSTDMGILVAYVPEGLPIAVTVVLTLVARRMLSKRVLVKNLTVIETLGCCSVICSDKTGTLTTNQMVVNSIVVGVNDLFNVGADMTNKEHVSRIATAAHLCNGAEFDRDDVIASTPIATRRVRGNATDAAMLRFSHVYADAVGQASSVYCAMNVPFNSSTKRMVTAIAPLTAAAAASTFLTELAGSSLAKNDQILLVKGAPDLLLPHCTAYASSNATDADLPLDTKALEQLKSLQESLSSKGERVLLLARRVLRSAKGQGATKRMSDDESAVQSLVAGGLTVLGLVGIVDPPRPEIKSVVGTMRGAGVRIFMVTGDFALTAGAIARQVGIFTTAATHTFADIERQCPALLATDGDSDEETTKDRAAKSRSRSTRPPLPKDATDADIAARMINDASLLLSGADLRNMTTAQWDLVCDYREIAFARTTPEQKLQIVHALQNRGNVVAVTGDGVNDAPALKNAHLGVAMGSGSEVAMAAGAMVLLDSNFSSLIEALRQGRVVFENLKKVSLYLIPAGTFSELMPVLLNLFFGVPQPLSSFLMIVICCGTDLVASIALMYEDAESDILNRNPRRPGRDNMVNLPLLGQAYFFLGVTQSVIAHCMYFLYMYREWGLTAKQLLFSFDQYAEGGAGFDGFSQDSLTNAAFGGQCVYFVTLVILQMGNIQAVRLRRGTMFRNSPFKNPMLFLSGAFSLLIAAFFVYMPLSNTYLQTYPIPALYWFIPIPLALIIPFLDELRKLRVRTAPDSLLARIAW